LARRVFAWLGILAACGCVPACGEADPKPIPQKDFISTLAKVVCDSVRPCCERQEIEFDAAGCQARNEALYAQTLPTANVKYDAQAAADCLALFREVAECGSAEDDVPGSDVCERIFVGQLQPGEPCQSSFECASTGAAEGSCNAVDDEPAACEQNERHSVVHGKLGQACDRTCSRASCTSTADEVPVGCYVSEGLFCGRSGSCEKLLAEGAPCRDFEECEEGSFCDSSGSELCTARRADGDACENSFECESEHCNDGSCGSRRVSETSCGASAP
jgi:hypothetical protein